MDIVGHGQCRFLGAKLDRQILKNRRKVVVVVIVVVVEVEVVVQKFCLWVKSSRETLIVLSASTCHQQKL